MSDLKLRPTNQVSAHSGADKFPNSGNLVSFEMSTQCKKRA